MLTPVQPIFANISNALSITVMVRLTLRIRNHLIRNSTLLIRKFTTEFRRVGSFISVLKLVKLVRRRLLGVIGNRTNILRTTGHARAISVTIFMCTLTNFNTLRINRRSLVLMVTRHEKLRLRLHNRLAGNMKRRSSLLQQRTRTSRPFTFGFA